MCESRVAGEDYISECNSCHEAICPNCAGAFHEPGDDSLFLDACQSCHPVCVGCHDAGAEDQEWWPEEGPLCRGCIAALWGQEAHLFDVEFTPPGLGHPSMPADWRAPSGAAQEA